MESLAILMHCLKRKNVLSHKLTTVRLTDTQEKKDQCFRHYWAISALLCAFIAQQTQKPEMLKQTQSAVLDKSCISPCFCNCKDLLLTCYKILAGLQVTYLASAGWTSCHSAPIATCEKLEVMDISIPDITQVKRVIYVMHFPMCRNPKSKKYNFNLLLRVVPEIKRKNYLLQRLFFSINHKASLFS